MTLNSYTGQILTQRTEREKRLLANPHNWFSLIGLSPLNEGTNSIGGLGGNSITIPGLPQEQFATVALEKGNVLLGGAVDNILVNNKPAELRRLQTDHDAETDVLSIGSIHIIVIRRGERFFLRVWDVQSPAARNFSGLNYFPVNPEYRIQAKFASFPEPKIVPIEDVIGTNYEVKYIGKAFFTINETPCSLIAELDEDELLFSFTDQTKTDATYPGGRLFTTCLPENDMVILDFNLARNWPCAYTPHATCPLPPFENHLPVRIEAGEKRYIKS